ncbi:MAG: TonB-dependent receptor [Gemmatimonadetes bacterium]|nr:TonB-dependent receptor [Gemmatimonadota bacterium]MYB99941.1 TonB-dependent receptor [Gemmatimonadota bacterium]
MRHPRRPAPAPPVILCLVGLAALAPALPLSAQSASTGGLRGRVLDQDGTPVEAALITLVHTRTGAASTALSVADGRYTLRGQRPGGPYTVTVKRIGFREFTREGIEVLLGRFVDLDIALVSEAIEVEPLVVEVEPDPVFNPGRIGISTLVTSEVLRDLPTLTRNFLDFAALSPLVRTSEEGVSVAGANYRFNTLNIDGALNQDVFGLSTNNVAGGRAGARVIPLEAVEQFQVEVAPFDIRQSGFTGGALNAVTRSGTNEFETSAFGFHRGGALVGELLVDDISTAPDVSTFRAGFTAGGPIRRDRAHFFVAGEWERVREPPTGLHVGESDPLRLSLVADSVARMRSLLQELGADAGTASSFALENQLANLFARVDWKIGERHDAMVRYSFAAADDEPDPNRLPGAAYEFSSGGSEIRSRNHSAVLRLVSALDNRFTNEFSANIQMLSDNETARSVFPQVEVTVDGTVGDLLVTRDVLAGADFFAQDNALDQRIIQLSNNLSYDVGDHQLLFGASGTWFHFDRRFVPGVLGSYEFGSLEDLARNRPNRYEVTIPLTGQGAAPTFAVREFGLYAQNEWEAHDRLTLRAGARFDLPIFTGRPEPNLLLEQELGIDASRLPDKRPTWSVRGGLNWRPFEGTQLRAGTGIFTGRPAYSWLANAFQNNGLAVTTLLCRGDQAPAFDPSNPPTECVGGPGVGESPPIINYFDPEFRFPQDLRTMIAIDQRLPGDVVFSASWLTNLALKQIFITNDNLSSSTTWGTPEDGYTSGFGFWTRHVWGVPVEGQEETLWAGGRLSELFGPVLRIGNRDGNYAYAATAELRKDFGDALALRAGYSLTRSANLQDLLSIDVTSNYATTPINHNPNDPTSQRSRFDRPHKVVASARTRILPQFGGTEISAMYVGQSGVPYSYVYDGDVNGDGFNGPRASRLANDLIYIPLLVSDLPTSFVTQLLWEDFLTREQCLQDQINRILARNTCHTPWSNRFDLRISQTVEARAFNAEVTLDMLNVLNFLNSSWGVVQVANPVVQLFRVRRESEDFGLDPLVAQYMGALRRDRTGRVWAARPFAPEVPTSQWRAQLGAKISLRR